MKYILMAVVAFALPLCAMADVTGKWSGTMTSNQGGDADTAFLILKQDGAVVTGSGGPNEEHQMAIRNGKVDGSTLTFEVALDDNRVMRFSLQSDGDTLSGDVNGQDKQTGDAKSGKLSLKRVAEK